MPSNSYGAVAARFLINEIVAVYETLPPSVFWSAAYFLIKVFPMLEVESIAYSSGMLFLIQWLVHALKIYIIESPDYTCDCRAITAPIVHGIPDALGDAAFVLTNWLGNEYIPNAWFGNYMQKAALVASGDMLGTFMASSIIRLIINCIAWDTRDKRPFLPSAVLTGVLSFVFTIVESAMLGDMADGEPDYDWWSRTFAIWAAMIPVASLLILFFTSSAPAELTSGPTLSVSVDGPEFDSAFLAEVGLFRAADTVREYAGARLLRSTGRRDLGIQPKQRLGSDRGHSNEKDTTVNPYQSAIASGDAETYTRIVSHGGAPGYGT